MCPNVISEKSYHNALCIELTASKLEARLCSDDVKRTTRTEELQFRFFLQTGVSTAYERETQKKEFFISRCFWKLLFVCSVRWTVLMWTVAAKVTDRVIAKGRQRRTKLCQNLPNLSSFPVFHAKLRIPQDILTFRHLILHFTLFQIIGIFLDMNWT